MALLPNEYGYFSDDGKEYVITRPDTPMPWINVISNGDYGMVLSQAGSVSRLESKYRLSQFRSGFRKFP